jgi:DNA-binding CsgD family transcriptional regulator
MAQADPILGLVTDLVRRMAGTDGVGARVDSMLDLVCDVVEAEVGLVIQSDTTHTVVRVMGRRMPPGAHGEVSRELELIRASDPILDPVAAGDLTPRSGEREFGADAWARSPQRAGCLRLCGVDQVCTLPLVGGPDFVIAMFARKGEDFSEDHLSHLARIQPVVAGMVALAGLRRLPCSEDHPRLTAREREVLVLLARGHTCTRIGRILGVSPRTVEVHLGRIYAKLDARDRLSAVLAAYDLGLIPPRSDEALHSSPTR